MIKSKDLNSEVKVLEEKIKAGKVELVDVVKALCLLVKVGRDIRTNQTTVMKFNKIPLIEPDEHTEGGTKKPQ